MTIAAGGQPYLSIVCTSRNDNHGGDMIRRMQIFVDGVVAQAKRHRLVCELIVVEWNPPADREPLADALRWPSDDGWCTCRVITVPRQMHDRLDHSDKMPLYQMIAKNVGIRRAKGEWVLSTNIDLLFSDPLFSFLSKKQLQPGFHYRSDRVDVEPEIPDDVSIDAQLAWCATHVMRENRPWGVVVAPKYAPPAEETTTKTRLRLTLHDLRDRIDDGLAALAGDVPGMPPRSAVVGVWRLAHLGSRLARTPFFPVVYWGLDRLANPSRKHAPFAEVVDVAFSSTSPLPPLHYGACGDFMLFHRDDWARMRGHPELPIFSFHLDSLTLVVAEAMGIHEIRLPPDHCQYHIEHGYWWKWSDRNNDKLLYQKMREKGLPALSYSTLRRLAIRLARPNPPNLSPPSWGFADEALPERQIARAAVNRLRSG